MRKRPFYSIKLISELKRDKIRLIKELDLTAYPSFSCLYFKLQKLSSTSNFSSDLHRKDYTAAHVKIKSGLLLIQQTENCVPKRPGIRIKHELKIVQAMLNLIKVLI